MSSPAPKSTKAKPATSRDRIAAYRRNNPDYAAREKDRSKAMGRAKSRLVKAHPRQYAQFLEEELEAVKLEKKLAKGR